MTTQIRVGCGERERERERERTDSCYKNIVGN